MHPWNAPLSDEARRAEIRQWMETHFASHPMPDPLLEEAYTLLFGPRQPLDDQL